MGSWKSVSSLEDGQNVEAATFNKPLSELSSRTTYLKEMVDAIGGDETKASLRFTVNLSEMDTPEVGDVVCINPVTKRFVKALSSMSVFDVFTASYTANAVGLLVLKDTETTGVVASAGIVNLSGFDIPSMLESGESLINGMYYVSAKEAGKITSNPQGPRIQLGFFSSNPQKSGRETGDFAFLNVQYGDLLSHRHRTYNLSAKPAGTQVTVDTSSFLLAKKYVFGYMPDALRAGGSAGEGSFVPYLRITGEWPSRDSVNYTIWLSRSFGSDPYGSPAPSEDFSDVWLHWKSSDPEETGSPVKIDAFHVPVSVGDHGMIVELDPGLADDLSKPYYSQSDDPSFRTWTISMPYYAKGWVSNLVEAESEFGSGTISVYGVLLNQTENVNVHVPQKVFKLPSVNPGVGDILDIDGTKYQFIDSETSESELDSDVIPAVIEGTPYQTFRNIASPYSDERPFSIVANKANSSVYIGASSVSLAGSQLVEVAAGGGILSSGGEVVAIVCDDGGMSLSDDGYVTFRGLSKVVHLNNGLSLYVRSSSSVQVDPGLTASLDTYNGVPGAIFRYNIEMDEDFNSEYPPVPAKSGSLMWNGIELESDLFFGEDAVYSIGPDSLYWYDDVLGRVPWSEAFKDPDLDLDIVNRQRLLFHYISSFHSETGPVVSLHPAKGAPITIHRCGTLENASVGDLELDVDLLAQVFNSDERGYKAVKASQHGKLLLGPVVEKIVAGPGIAIEQIAGQPDGQGTVTISATNASYSGEMDTIALENAKEEVVGMFPYVRLLGWNDGGTNIPTGFVAKFQVPTSVVDDVYRVKLYATVFGENSFENEPSQQFAGIRMTYNILPDWSPITGTGVETASLNLKSDLIAPDSSMDINIPFGVTNSSGGFDYKAFDPILVHNDPLIPDVMGRSAQAFGGPLPSEADCSGYLSTHVIGTSTFGVRPGYIVSVRFSRTEVSGNSAYTGKLGFINLRWALVKASSDEVVNADMDVVDSDKVIANLRKVALTLNSGNVRSVDQIRTALLSIINQLK